MTSDSTNGSGVSFPAANPFVNLGDILLSPGRVVPMSDDDVGRFDESSFYTNLPFLL